MKCVIDNARDEPRLTPQQPPRTFGDGIEHRLDVDWRTGDDVENLRGRSLPFQRFPCCVEQVNILDRDHRLVGESLQEPDMVLAECAGRPARSDDDTDGLALAHQRDEQHAAISAGTRDVPRRRLELGIRELRCCTIGHEVVGRETSERRRERRLQHPITGRVGRREGRQMSGAVDITKHRSGKAADQPVGVGRNGVEHRLHVGR
jgi:hypothetical protein